MGKNNNTEKTKKSSRLLVAAIIIFIIGALLCTGGMFALDWNFTKLDVSNYTPNSWTDETGEEITFLELRVSGRDVTVNAAEEGAANMTWFDSDSEKIEVSFSQGKLTVRERYHFVFGPFFHGFNRENDKLTINIPESVLETLDIKLSGGTFKVNGIETVNKIKLDISGGSGDLSGIQQTDTLDYHGSGGTIKLNDIKTNSINFDQSGGAAYFDNIDTKALNCKQSGGLLRMLGLTIDNLDIKTSGGTMVGVINGVKADYSITVSKSGGTCNVKEQSGNDKGIKIKQSGGTINLSFE